MGTREAVEGEDDCCTVARGQTDHVLLEVDIVLASVVDELLGGLLQCLFDTPYEGFDYFDLGQSPSLRILLDVDEDDLEICSLVALLDYFAKELRGYPGRNRLRTKDLRRMSDLADKGYRGKSRRTRLHQSSAMRRKSGPFMEISSG